MKAGNKEKNKDKWYYKLRDKYRLVIMNDVTFEERLSFRLTRLNVIVLLSVTTVLLIGLTTLIIAFTPLREYIPGYTDVTLRQRIYELQSRTDSLERIFYEKDIYLQNIKNILEGKIVEDSLAMPDTVSKNFDTITMKRSPEDSILRQQFEEHNRYNLYYDDQGALYQENSKRSLNFFKPLDGVITANFSLAENHLGIDIVAKQNESIKAAMDGTVLWAEWTVKTGYVIAVQHQFNYVTIYKHNSALLKKQGDYIKAGDPIAIIGGTGELSTGLHLHFELWYNGSPVNPLNYMTF